MSTVKIFNEKDALLHLIKIGRIELHAGQFQTEENFFKGPDYYNSDEIPSEYRTLKKIEAEIDENVPLGNIGKVMDLIDEYGNTMDAMCKAIIDGDIDRIYYLEQFEIDITEESFVIAAVRNDQLMVVANQIRRGLDVNLLIDIAERESNQLIWSWAKCWKSVEARNTSRTSK